ncbi:hypothetical protein J6590_008801 [Homalodisca vitripennis]|nr:hypothetical protein J6590_008801 [Homalodisca vitripennis]
MKIYHAGRKRLSIESALSIELLAGCQVASLSETGIRITDTLGIAEGLQAWI